MLYQDSDLGLLVQALLEGAWHIQQTGSAMGISEFGGLLAGLQGHYSSSEISIPAKRRATSALACAQHSIRRITCLSWRDGHKICASIPGGISHRLTYEIATATVYYSFLCILQIVMVSGYVEKFGMRTGGRV